MTPPTLLTITFHQSEDDVIRKGFAVPVIPALFIRTSTSEKIVLLFLNKSVIASSSEIYERYLQPIITQYFIDNKSEIWLLFLIAHSKR